MKLFAAVCCAVFCLTVEAHAQAKPNVTLSVSDRQHVLQDTFVVSRTTAAIPESVKRAYLSPTRQTQFRMAEPGQPFTEGDVYKGLPWLRLVLIATNNDYCILHYEQGGYGGPYCRVTLFRLTGDKAKIVYTGQSSQPYTGVTDLRWDVWAHALFETTQFIL